jgi:hypothetical protein
MQARSNGYSGIPPLRLSSGLRNPLAGVMGGLLARDLESYRAGRGGPGGESRLRRLLYHEVESRNGDYA